MQDPEVDHMSSKSDSQSAIGKPVNTRGNEVDACW